MGTTPPSPVARAAIGRYLREWIRLRSDLLAWCTDTVEPADSIRDILRLVRADRKLPRGGPFGDGLEYGVHGAGCAIVDRDGAVVDADVGPGGREVVTAWKILFWGGSLTPPLDLDIGDLRASLQALADAGELGAVDEWRYLVPEAWPD